jgi:hypothetical protein
MKEGKLAVYIYDRDAFEKIVLVEGEEYRRYKSEDEFGDCSFNAFYREWRKGRQPLWWYRLRRWLGIPFGRFWKYDFGMSMPYGNAAIYGLYGWNRYTVKGISGEILFMRPFGTAKDAQKAQRVGFRLN